MRIISDDSTVFDETWKSLDLNLKCHCKKDKKNKNTNKKKPWINVNYLYRALFRVCDVFSRVCLISMAWIVINGYVAVILLIIDCQIVFYVIIQQKR